MSARRSILGVVLFVGLWACTNTEGGRAAAPPTSTSTSTSTSTPTPTPTPTPTSTSTSTVLVEIARELETLGARCPRLAQFRAASHLHGDEIRYEYRVHRSTGRGGWSSGVPEPDADGLWLHIDVHDKASTRQLHTQPMVPLTELRDGRVLMLLLLEGDATAGSCGAAIREIVSRRGRDG